MIYNIIIISYLLRVETMGFCIPSLSSFLCIHSAVDHDSEAVIAILDWLASFCSSLGSVRAIGHGLKNMDFPIDKTADGRRGFFLANPKPNQVGTTAAWA